MRTVIFANGEFAGGERVVDAVRPGDRVIAVDGGTRYALAVGMMPDVVIGDLDSLGDQERACVEGAGARIVSFPPGKDETDLELALLYAARAGATEITILAALGGRLDQMVANLLLLTLPELAGIDVRIEEGAQTAFPIRPGTGGAVIEGSPGDTVSLIPLSGDAKGVTTRGLEWPLDGEMLRFGRARGVSNVMKARQAWIDLQAGLLLCVVTRNSL